MKHVLHNARKTLGLVAMATVVAWISTAHAEAWPDRPIRLVAPFAPGGVTDIAARAAANSMSQQLGQPVIVENKSGAQGLVGSTIVKDSAPDGYTIVLMSSSVACVNPYLRKNMPFDVQKDFEAIGVIGSVPVMMVVSPHLPVNDMREFVDYVRENPGRISYSSPGVGGSGHLYGSLINSAQKIDMQHVPYRGGAPAMQAVLAGDVAMTFADTSFADSQVKTGKLKALGISGNERWPTLPTVPTFGEQGYPSNLIGWVGLMAPANTPRPIIERLNGALRSFAEDPAQRDSLLRIGVLATGGAPETMNAAIRDGCPPWGEAVKNAGIQPE